LKDEPQQPTAVAEAHARACVEKLPTSIQSNIHSLVLEIWNSHHEWRTADKSLTNHVNDPTYAPSWTKWKSKLQAPKEVLPTMAFKSVESSLDKIVERTKKSQIQAALAVQRLSRDQKRDHTIFLVWKLLMMIARCTINSVTGSKPDDNLVVYVLMVVVHDKQTTFKAMFDCEWGEALLVLDEQIMRLPKLKDAPPSYHICLR